MQHLQDDGGFKQGFCFFISLTITFGFHLSTSFMYSLKEKGNKDVSAMSHSSILGSSKLRILLKCRDTHTHTKTDTEWTRIRSN